ncbi:MAG: nitrile hydratase subunit beta, partial [Alphaproteobacteria bacterium]
MDGPHDLGGRQGFGPVAVVEKEESFHSVWEGRMWGISRGLSWPPGWTLDWWRHSRELIDPTDYLTRPYFDQWMQTYAAILIDSDVFSVADLARAAAGPEPARDASPEPIDTSKMGRGYDREIAETPRFVIGDQVTANRLGAPGHTRLPGYLRGQTGVVDHYYGGHVLPDASAKGRERAEPLYSVKFAAETLWPEAKD